MGGGAEDRKADKEGGVRERWHEKDADPVADQPVRLLGSRDAHGGLIEC